MPFCTLPDVAMKVWPAGITTSIGPDDVFTICATMLTRPTPLPSGVPGGQSAPQAPMVGGSVDIAPCGTHITKPSNDQPAIACSCPALSE